MQNQMAIILPSDVPTPRFTMFQRVDAEFPEFAWGRNKIPAIVTGMTYVSLKTALHGNTVGG